MNPGSLQHAVCASVDAHAQTYTAASDAIWEHPEVNFHEDASAGILRALLLQNGFSVTDRLDGMPNAFRAEYGSGRPVLAFLGEFDALSAMSQKAGCAVREPVTPGAPGHGCGHNLLGVGSLAAAVAVKEVIAAGLLSGTVVYFGCPAEETGSAKTFLARDGFFDGLDAILSWHPWDYNGIWPGGSLANVKMIFRFTGQSAHAAGSPELGRSALDALELMNVGVQFLREHVPEDTRIHYAITDAGGLSPNVVQARAEAVYLVRSQRLADLEGIKQRVIDCARGAAIMTGTTMEMEFVKGCSNILPNTAMEEVLISSMQTVGAPGYTQTELALARSLHDSLEAPERTLAKLSRLCASDARERVMAHQGEPIYSFIAPHTPTDAPIVTISTDAGDASWCAPTSQLSAAAWAADTPAHSWQAVAIGKSSIAHKAMLFAAKSLALSAARLMDEPETLSRARREFLARTKDHPYVCPIPADVQPRL
ncbi:MAG: amidohydrolase [Candidatus Ventricola sp.]|nr:amidohydrolase [Candidatus Ventricola sp.]